MCQNCFPTFANLFIEANSLCQRKDNRQKICLKWFIPVLVAPYQNETI